jgi:hypothetical protein
VKENVFGRIKGRFKKPPVPKDPKAREVALKATGYGKRCVVACACFE